MNRAVKYISRFVIWELIALMFMLQWTLAANVKSGGGIPLFNWEVLMVANLVMVAVAFIMAVFFVILMFAMHGTEWLEDE